MLDKNDQAKQAAVGKTGGDRTYRLTCAAEVLRALRSGPGSPSLDGTVVGTVDGPCRLVPEAEYQALLNKGEAPAEELQAFAAGYNAGFVDGPEQRRRDFDAMQAWRAARCAGVSDKACEDDDAGRPWPHADYGGSPARRAAAEELERAMGLAPCTECRAVGQHKLQCSMRPDPQPRVSLKASEVPADVLAAAAEIRALHKASEAYCSHEGAVWRRAGDTEQRVCSTCHRVVETACPKCAPRTSEARRAANAEIETGECSQCDQSIAGHTAAQYAECKDMLAVKLRRATSDAQPDDGCDCEAFEGGEHTYLCASTQATERRAKDSAQRSGEAQPANPYTARNGLISVANAQHAAWNEGFAAGRLASEAARPEAQPGFVPDTVEEQVQDAWHNGYRDALSAAALRLEHEGRQSSSNWQALMAQRGAGILRGMRDSGIPAPRPRRPEASPKEKCRVAHVHGPIKVICQLQEKHDGDHVNGTVRWPRKLEGEDIRSYEQRRERGPT